MLSKGWEHAEDASDVMQRMMNVRTLTCARTETAKEEALQITISFSA